MTMDLALITALAGGRPLAPAACGQATGTDALAACQDLGLPVALEAGRLAWRPRQLPLPAEALEQAALAAGWPCPVRVLEVTDSTNARLLAEAVAGASAPQALFAEWQAAGRGRRQRPWLAGHGDAILLSLLVKVGRPPAEWPGLAIATGVAVADCLLQAGVAGIGLKWPNDLVIDGAKVAGILVEAPGTGATPGSAVLGLGLNWRLPEATRTRLQEPAGSLGAVLSGSGIDRAGLAGRLLVGLLAMSARFAAQGLSPFLDGFRRFDVLQDQPVQLYTGVGRVIGIARGLASDGALLVDQDGQRSRHHSAEVSVRPA